MLDACVSVEECVANSSENRSGLGDHCPLHQRVSFERRLVPCSTYELTTSALQEFLHAGVYGGGLEQGTDWGSGNNQ